MDNSDTTPKPFRLQGVIGIVSMSINELANASKHQLQCVEIRADLLLQAGNSAGELLDIVCEAKAQGLATLFTLWHPSRRGVFAGSENERVDISQGALDTGANVVDLEWDTQVAKQLLAQGEHLNLSYHDFKGIPTKSELSALTQSMSAISAVVRG
ncbi:MAG: 3-dehydroquinate dehydratase [Pseudomonadales bacterium]|jgi:3-dehydroquinate dehydratase